MTYRENHEPLPDQVDRLEGQLALHTNRLDNGSERFLELEAKIEKVSTWPRTLGEFTLGTLVVAGILFIASFLGLLVISGFESCEASRKAAEDACTQLCTQRRNGEAGRYLYSAPSGNNPSVVCVCTWGDDPIRYENWRRVDEAE